MKLRIATVLVVSITALASLPAPAQDGAALFKTKCAMCHGDQGQGKPSMTPEVAGTTKDVSDLLTKGGEAKVPHIKPMSALTPDQVSSIAAYVKTLK
jgi:mono/diheme cytochrome c family protein